MAQNMAVIGLQHKQARLTGEIELLQERNRRYQARIDELTIRIAANNARIVDLEGGVKTVRRAAQLAFSVSLAAPIPRKTYPKRHYAPWGAITRTLLILLAASKRTPRSTKELAEAMNQQLQLGLSKKDLAHLQETIRHRLKALRNRGLVQPASKSMFPGEPTTWLIKDTAV